MVKVTRRHDEKTDRLIAAVGTCETCGRELDFHPVNAGCAGAVDCGCGAVYNTSGQRLKPRDQWEEPLEEI